MCGICGVFTKGKAVDRTALVRMRDTMVHRGPDGEGLYVDPTGQVGLGHRRLAIIDIQGGAQPMADIYSKYTIVFNGELYNYKELRSELKTTYSFKTKSDTEVILAAFNTWGKECLERFNGMFGLAIYDQQKQTLLLARDHAGIKPLYYATHDNNFLFSSEIKALYAYSNAMPRPNLEGVADYLTFQHTLGEKTMFEGVSKVSPGHWIEITPNGLSHGQFFSYNFSKLTLSFEESVEEFQWLLQNAINLQLRSDVPLGAHLSGGLDTGMLTALSIAQLGRSIPAFSAGFSGGGMYDDTHYAQQTASHVGAQLHIDRPGREDFIKAMPSLIWAMDEPAAGEGLFAQYRVSRMAAADVTVALGGQGADETWGGYARHFLFLWLNAVRRKALQMKPMAGHDIEDLAEMLPQLSAYWPLWRKVMTGPAFPDEEECAFHICARNISPLNDFTPAGLHRLGEYDPRREFGRLFQAASPDAEPLDKLLHYETTQFLPALLHVEDRASMINSLESRVPFLDPRIIQFSFRLPPGIKMRQGLMKAVPRDYAARLLPKNITNRHVKVGFPVPLTKWQPGQIFKELIGEVPRELAGLMHIRSTGMTVDSPADRRFWGELNLCLWWKTFME